MIVCMFPAYHHLACIYLHTSLSIPILTFSYHFIANLQKWPIPQPFQTNKHKGAMLP